MALKDEDTLMKRKRELDEAIRNLGVSFDEDGNEEKDELAAQFMMDEEALAELNKQKDEQ